MSLYASYASSGSLQAEETRVRFADDVGLSLRESAGGLPPTRIAVPSHRLPTQPLSGQPCPGAHACLSQCVAHRPTATVFPSAATVLPPFAAVPGSTILNGEHPLVIFPGGMAYEGEWRDSKMHGQGKITFPPPDGGVYEGEFRDNHRHGKGKRTFAGGGWYEGEWCNDKRHGQGTYVHCNGEARTGEWHQGRMHGAFAKTSPDGQTDFEVWRNGVPASLDEAKSSSGPLPGPDTRTYSGSSPAAPPSKIQVPKERTSRSSR
jgi:hypothetical protein